MTDKLKAQLIVVITAIIALLTIWLSNLQGTPDPAANPSPSASPSIVVMPTATITPSVSPIPSASPSPTVWILDTFERPEFVTDSTKWKTSVTKTILDGQTTSFILKASDPCQLVGIQGIQSILPVLTTKASATTYKTGTYYDALTPLTSANCATAGFLQIDVMTTTQIGTATIAILTKQTKAPTKPSIDLTVEYNFDSVKTKFCPTTLNCYDKMAQGIQLLNSHRISAHKTSLSPNTWIPSGLSYQNVGYGNYPAANAYSVTTLPKWIYSCDESNCWTVSGTTYSFASLITTLTAWQTNASAVKRMVTLPMKGRWVGSKNLPIDPAAEALIDIHAPVAEQLCLETWKGSGDWYPCAADYAAAGKELWMYVSNMSHGSTTGVASGAPDLVLDAPAVNEFGFYAVAAKYGIKNLLYYNSTQNWSVQDVYSNPYIFGGDGDGLLLWPGSDQTALPSVRIKALREASQTIDIIYAAGLQAELATLVNTPVDWIRDMSKFEALREKALGLLQ